jgi:hypothetical protein
VGVYVKLKIWWEKLKSSDGLPWYLFVHAVNDSTSTLTSSQIELTQGSPEDAHRPLRYSELQFAVPRSLGIHRMAIGIYRLQPVEEKLTADAGVRDWNDQRELIPIH